jgi:hypothetical protein
MLKMGMHKKTAREYPPGGLILVPGSAYGLM